MKKWMGILLLVVLLTGCSSSASSVYYEEGVKSLESGDYDTAVLYFQKSVNEENRLPEAYRGLGISNYETGEYYAAATALLQSLDALNGRNIDFQTDVMDYLAAAYIALGNYDDAADVYTDLLDLSKTADTYYLRGCVYLEMGEYESAMADFEAMIHKSPEYDSYLQVWEAYRDQGIKTEGEVFLQEALEIEPEEASDYTSRGTIYYEMEEYENAKSELTQAISEGDSSAYVLLVQVYLTMDDAASARSVCQNYLNSEGSDQAQAYNCLAMCDIYEENYEDALTNIKSGLALEDESENQQLLYNEIVVYEYLLDFDTAYEKIQSYLALYPDDEEALRESEFLSTR